MPKSSFIEANNFASIKLLASHLLELNINHFEYLKFFEWKRHANVKYFNSDISFGVSSLLCDICIRLNVEDAYRKKKKSIPNSLSKLDSTKVCQKLNLESVVALFYFEDLTDRDPTFLSIFGIVKKIFKNDLANLYYSRSFSGILDKINGLY